MKTDAEGLYESTETVLEGQRKHGSTSSKKLAGASGVNVVTWGCFRSREIVSTTIIESESFRAWAEESYSLYTHWARCFPKDSEEQKFLQGLKNEVVLVSIVGQQYVGDQGRRLWEFLLED